MSAASFRVGRYNGSYPLRCRVADDEKAAAIPSVRF
jgi:hypothetical protein